MKPVSEDVLEAARMLAADGPEPEHAYVGNPDGTVSHFHRRKDGTVEERELIVPGNPPAIYRTKPSDEPLPIRVERAPRPPQKLEVSLARQVDGTFRLTLPNGVSVPVNRHQRRTLDAEARRKKRRGHARH